MEVNDKNTDKIVKALRPDEKLSSTTKEALANEINVTTPSCLPCPFLNLLIEIFIIQNVTK